MSFQIDSQEILTKMGMDFDISTLGTAQKDIWVTLDAMFKKSDSGSIKIPDISMWASKLLVVNQKAYDLLLDIISNLGEFLKIEIESQPYYMFNTINTLDNDVVALDKSEKAIFDGEEVGVAHLEFIEDNIPSSNVLFNVKYDNGAYLFCDDEFKDFVKENRLTGLEFSSELAVNPLDDF